MRKRRRGQSLYELAVDALAEGQAALALVAARRYLELCPNALRGRLLLAEILADLRRFAEAEAILTSLGRFRRLPERYVVACAWAHLMNTRGRYEEARVWLERAVEAEPGSTAPRILLGACVARLGRLTEAESIHREATTLEGDPDEAWLNLAFVLRAQGRFEEAVEAVSRALELCPDYPEAVEVLEDLEAALALGFEPR